MKCKNCGADIAAEALQCAYCGTANPGGVRFWKRLKEKREENKRFRRELLLKSRETYINKMLNRTMLILGILMVVFVLIAANAVSYAKGYGAVSEQQAVKVMNEFYESGAYLRLYNYMSKHDLIGNDHYEYSKVALLNNCYESFLKERNACADIIRKEEVLDDEQIRSVIESGIEVLYIVIPAYPNICPEEKKITDEHNMMVTDFFKGTLGFGEKELDYIQENVFYGRLGTDECEKLVETARNYLLESGDVQ